MLRVTNYFETQVRVPMGTQTTEHPLHPNQLRGDPEFNLNNLTPMVYNPESRKMTDEQVVSWYSKILESVRLRYRKLQRFTR